MTMNLCLRDHVVGSVHHQLRQFQIRRIGLCLGLERGFDDDRALAVPDPKMLSRSRYRSRAWCGDGADQLLRQVDDPAPKEGRCCEHSRSRLEVVSRCSRSADVLWSSGKLNRCPRRALELTAEVGDEVVRPRIWGLDETMIEVIGRAAGPNRHAGRED